MCILFKLAIRLLHYLNIWRYKIINYKNPPWNTTGQVSNTAVKPFLMLIFGLFENLHIFQSLSISLLTNKRKVVQSYALICSWCCFTNRSNQCYWRLTLSFLFPSVVFSRGQTLISNGTIHRNLICIFFFWYCSSIGLLYKNLHILPFPSWIEWLRRKNDLFTF